MNDSFVNRKIIVYHKINALNQIKSHCAILKKQNVLITVDDGDISFYEHLFPIIKEHELNAILFVITELIDSDKPFWWDELVYMLGKEEGERKVWEVKNWPNYARVEYLDKLRSNCDKPELKQVQLTTTQLKEMEAAGVIIANHSHTHPMFDQCTEVELRSEFQQSKSFFDRVGLKGYGLFAYPNGNVSMLAEKIAKEEGIKYAFLFDHKLPDKIFNPFRISRLSITDQTSANKLRFILSGWHSRLLPIRKNIHKLLNG